jgi:hypothetical protein
MVCERALRMANLMVHQTAQRMVRRMANEMEQKMAHLSVCNRVPQLRGKALSDRPQRVELSRKYERCSFLHSNR